MGASLPAAHFPACLKYPSRSRAAWKYFVLVGLRDAGEFPQTCVKPCCA